MRHRSPHQAGSAAIAASDRVESSARHWTDWAARLELVPRLQALVDELRVVDADTDVPLTLAEGLLEDVEAAL